MPSESPHPSHSVLTSSKQRSTRRMRGIIRQVIYRLLLLVLLALLGAPAVPPPVGAIQPLWAEAADLRALKSYTAAVEVYEQIAILSPQDLEPLLAMGEIYLAQRRWPMAEDAFNRALARSGEDTSLSRQALAGLAEACWEQGDRLRAVMLWEAALAFSLAGRDGRVVPRASGLEGGQEPGLPGVRMRLALAYLDTGRPADAEAMLRQEMARSDNPAAHLYLAMLLAADDANDARRELAAITDDGPPALVAARDYLLAALDKAKAAGSAAGAAKSLGLAFVQIEEWQLARASLERALILDPTDAEAMAFLGHTEAQLGRPAFTHLAAAVETRPDWPLGHYLLGLYYLKQEVYEFAAEEFRVTLRLDPGNAQAQVDLARAYVGLGQYLAAEEALRGAVESAPDDLTFHLALLRFYANHTSQITGRGLDAAQTAADLAPDDPQARDMLGWMYLLAGDPPLARLHLESALRLDPELVSAHYHLGVLREALGEEEAARCAFLRAIDLDTDGFYRGQAQTALREMAQARE